MANLTSIAEGPWGSSRFDRSTAVQHHLAPPANRCRHQRPHPVMVKARSQVLGSGICWPSTGLLPPLPPLEPRARRVSHLLRTRRRVRAELGEGGRKAGMIDSKPARVQALLPEQILDHQVRTTWVRLDILPDLRPDRRSDRRVRYRGPDARSAHEIRRPSTVDRGGLNLAVIGE